MILSLARLNVNNFMACCHYYFLFQPDIILTLHFREDETMANNKVTTTVRLDENIYKQLQQVAEKEVRSVNNLIEYALTKFIQDYHPEK
jgi:hypothetical protein